MTDAPHVVLIVTSRQTAQLFVLGFGRHLRDRGVRVTLVCDEADELPLGRSPRDPHPLPVPLRRDPSPVRDGLALLTLVRGMRQLRPDAVVYATPKAGLLGALAARLAGVPVRVYELWGLRLETVHGPGGRLLALLERVTVLASTAVLPNSHSLARRAGELGLTRGRPVTVLGAGSSHGVDTARFSPQQVAPGRVDAGTRAFLGLSQDRGQDRGTVVGFVGRLHPDKGIDTLLAAVDRCARRHPDLRLLLVGADEGVDPRARAPRLFEQGQAHVVGPVDDLAGYYAAMDVLVLPSRREGLPNVVLEAAAAGLPSIVTDATGVVDSVVHDQTGLVVPVDDVEALAEALDRLVGDHALRARLGAGARRRIEEEFSQEQVWQRRGDHLLELLARARPATPGPGSARLRPRRAGRR